MSTPDRSAASDPDVVVLRDRLFNTPLDPIARAAVNGALDRIELRLAAGKSHAEIVDACIKAGHITKVATGGRDG